MQQNLSHRRATASDLKAIIALLLEDSLGQTREHLEEQGEAPYLEAFALIDRDPNQYLMVVELNSQIVATCHLTIMPSLTFTGSTRLQIEAVRVDARHRGQKIGQWLINAAIDYGKSRGTTIIQLTTNKKRPRAKKFYETIGFKPSHVGMKLYISEG
jgi:GNAT superfamily N-acetyltransferase